LDIKRAEGDYTGACPVYGYIKDESNRNRLVIDEYPADIVREIFRMKLEGFSAVQIANILNERCVSSPIEYKKEKGLPHPKGGYGDKDDARWSATTIIRILKDETYVGTLVQGKTGTPNYKIRDLVNRPESEWQRVENAHDFIIQKHNFDLVQKIMKLDTRTSPRNDKVYLFSGILVCGCCGNRMTRKTNTYKGNKHHYYYCPTTKKRGCPNAVFIKEDDLIECALINIKAYISNVISLDDLIQKMDAKSLARDLTSHLRVQLSENEQRLEEIRGYKTMLYENLLNGNLNKDEYKSLKDKYTCDIEELVTANTVLQKEIDAVLACNHERLMWIEHFKNFSNIETIDRKTVIQLIQSIKVADKSTIQITFNYQSEYDKACEMTLSREAV
jgi:hypothetical protein